MKNQTLIAASTLAIAGGCTTIPNPSVFEVQVHDVVRHVLCEVRDAMWNWENNPIPPGLSAEQRNRYIQTHVKPRFDWLKDQSLTADFDLDVTQTDANTGDFAFSFPMMPAGVVTLTTEGGTSTAATRDEGFSIRTVFSERRQWTGGAAQLVRVGTDKTEKILYDPGHAGPAKSMKFSTVCDDLEPRAPGISLLAGGVGVQSFFARMNAIEKTADNQPRSLTFTAKFVVKANSGIGPRFTMIPINRAMSKLFGASFKLTSARADTHQVTLTFGKLAPYNPYIPVDAVYDFSDGEIKPKDALESAGAPGTTKRKIDIGSIRRRGEPGDIPRINRLENEDTLVRRRLRRIEQQVDNLQ